MSSSATTSPSVAPTTPAATATPTPTPAPTPTPLQAPSAPMDFHFGDLGNVACDNPDVPGGQCVQLPLRWTSTSGPGTWFRIYQAWDLPSADVDRTCDDIATEAEMVIETAPDATSAQIVAGGIATGGGHRCLWISAVNDAGESQRVAGTYAP